MQRGESIAGYTLIEVIVALVVFAVGALSLAASSGVIARGMAMNELRERGRRIASNRIEVIKSQCGTAESGRERVRQIESAWSVVRMGRSRVSVTEFVAYMSPRGPQSQTYRTVVWCPS